jgi:hypothetical protein
VNTNRAARIGPFYDVRQGLTMLTEVLEPAGFFVHSPHCC